MYDNGEGVPENDVYAYMWLDIASFIGDAVSYTHLTLPTIYSV